LIYDYLKTRFPESIIPDFLVSDVGGAQYKKFGTTIADDKDL